MDDDVITMGKLARNLSGQRLLAIPMLLVVEISLCRMFELSFSPCVCLARRGDPLSTPLLH